MIDYKNKDSYLREIKENLYFKSLSMFNYTGLPETVDRIAIEKSLQMKGHVFFFEHKGNIYALDGSFIYERDMYNRPTHIRIDNVYLDIHKEYEIGVDGVLVSNDYFYKGLESIYERYGSMLVENEITMFLDIFNSRINILLTAGDDLTKESAELFLERIVQGDLGIIGENRIFDGLRTHNTKTNAQNNIQQLIEHNQFIKTNVLNEIGIDSNHNMKRERLNSDEVNKNQSLLQLLPDMMLQCREAGVELVNEFFNLDIEVMFDSIWKTEDETLTEFTDDNSLDLEESDSHEEIIEDEDDLEEDEEVEETEEELEEDEEVEETEEELEEEIEEDIEELKEDVEEIQKELDLEEEEVKEDEDI